jgi:hypothetical protein
MKEKELFSEALTPPAPPPQLADRVLAAAAGAARDLESPHWIDRLWESRSLRLVWLASLLIVLLLHATLPAPPAATPPRRPARATAASEGEWAALTPLFARPRDLGRALRTRHELLRALDLEPTTPQESLP